MYQRLHEEPLETSKPEDNELYEPVYQRLAEADDPRGRSGPITSSGTSSSGTWRAFSFSRSFEGSGKTTELLRLKQRLSQAGHIVLYANALDYINPSEFSTSPTCS